MFLRSPSAKLKQIFCWFLLVTNIFTSFWCIFFRSNCSSVPMFHLLAGRRKNFYSTVTFFPSFLKILFVFQSVLKADKFECYPFAGLSHANKATGIFFLGWIRATKIWLDQNETVKCPRNFCIVYCGAQPLARSFLGEIYASAFCRTNSWY